VLERVLLLLLLLLIPVEVLDDDDREWGADERSVSQWAAVRATSIGLAASVEGSLTRQGDCSFTCRQTPASSRLTETHTAARQIRQWQR
jgi:hypothetical protein